MLLLFTIFLKRPNYAIWLIPVFIAFLIGCVLGNTFPSIVLLVLSTALCGYRAMVKYILEENVNAKILNVDLKEYAEKASLILLVYSVVLFMAWIPVLLGPNLSVFAIFTIMNMTFVPFVLMSIIGFYLLAASIILKAARSDIKLNKQSAEMIFEEIKNLIAQS